MGTDRLAYPPHPDPRDALSVRRRAAGFAAARMPSARGLVHGAPRVPQPVDPPCPDRRLRDRFRGNYSAAVAYAAEKLGIRAQVFVPEIATSAKIGRIQASGAEAVVAGASYAKVQARCDAYVAESGALSIHPYRLALPPLDAVMVAVGGGGLIAASPLGSRAGSRSSVSSRSFRARCMPPLKPAGRSTLRSSRSRRFDRRVTGRRSQLRHRAEIRSAGRTCAGPGHRRSATTLVERRLDRLRAGRGGNRGAGERAPIVRNGGARQRPPLLRERHLAALAKVL